MEKNLQIKRPISNHAEKLGIPILNNTEKTIVRMNMYASGLSIDQMNPKMEFL